MSLDWKPCKEEEIKENDEKTTLLRHTVKEFLAPCLDPLARYCAALCVSVWDGSPRNKLK